MQSVNLGIENLTEICSGSIRNNIFNNISDAIHSYTMNLKLKIGPSQQYCCIITLYI